MKEYHKDSNSIVFAAKALAIRSFPRFVQDFKFKFRFYDPLRALHKLLGIDPSQKSRDLARIFSSSYHSMISKFLSSFPLSSFIFPPRTSNFSFIPSRKKLAVFFAIEFFGNSIKDDDDFLRGRNVYSTPQLPASLSSSFQPAPLSPAGESPLILAVRMPPICKSAREWSELGWPRQRQEEEAKEEIFVRSLQPKFWF